MGAVVDPGAARLDELAGRDHCGVADDRDQVALASGFDPQDAKTVLLVMEVTRSTRPARTSVGMVDLAGCAIPV